MSVAKRNRSAAGTAVAWRLLALTLSVAVVGCGRSPEAAPAGGPPQMPPMPVTVRTVAPQAVPILIDAVGQAEGSKEVEVRARVTGLLQRQQYREGEAVRAGAPLFTIERAPFEIALAQERAALAQEQARVDQAQRELRRLEPLAQQGMIPRRDADTAASNLSLAEASRAAAQAKVREAELNLSYTNVTAPIAGVAGRAEKSEGSLVTPADGLLARLTQTDPIWVRFAFSEAEIARLRASPAQSVRLLGPDGQPLATDGRLNFAGTTVDARLGTVQLRAAFANPELKVLPGQFVRAQVQAGEQQAFLVPQAAVVSTDQGRSVWTLQDGKATPTPVEVGNWVGTDWVVLKGLKTGDQVIVDNLIKIRPGAPVTAKPVADAASAPASAASR